MALVVRLGWLFSCFLISNSGQTQSPQNNSVSMPPVFISGFVFLDSNHNGIKDDNEQGIKGASVSDLSFIQASDTHVSGKTLDRMQNNSARWWIL